MLTTKLGVLESSRAPLSLPFQLDLAHKKNYSPMAISTMIISFGIRIQVLKETSTFTIRSSNVSMLTKWKFKVIIIRLRPVSLSSCSTAAILRLMMEFVDLITRLLSGFGASSSSSSRINNALAVKTLQAIRKSHLSLGFFGFPSAPKLEKK